MMLVAGVLMWAGTAHHSQYLKVTILGTFDISYIVIAFGILSLVTLTKTKRSILSYGLIIVGAIVGLTLIVWR